MCKFSLCLSLFALCTLTGCNESTLPKEEPVSVKESLSPTKPKPQAHQAQNAEKSAAQEKQVTKQIPQAVAESPESSDITAKKESDLAALTSYTPPKVNTDLSAEELSIDQAARAILLNDDEPETIYVLLEHKSAEARRLALQTIYYRWTHKGLEPQFSKIIDRISDPNQEVAALAIKFFRYPGPHVEAALPALVWATKEEYERSSEAYYSLDSLGAASAPLVPYLIQIISELPADDDRDAWYQVSNSIELLGNIGPAALRAKNEIQVYLQDTGSEPRASQALAQMGATDILLAHIEKEGENVSSWVIGNLGELPEPNPQVFQVLKDTLENSPYASHRSMAVMALAKLNTQLPQASDLILAALEDSQGEVRAEAAKAISLLNPQPEDAVKLLKKALQDEDEDVRDEAAYALSQIKEDQDEVFEALMEGVVKGDITSSVNISLTISGKDEFLPKLLEVVQDENRTASQRAFAALCFEQYAPEVLSKHAELFAQILKDPEQPASLRGAVSMLYFSKDVEDELVSKALKAGATQNESAYIRWRALDLLGEEDPALALPALLEALNGTDLLALDEAMRSLRKLGPLAAPAVPRLRIFLNSGLDDLAASAAVTLGSIGAAAQPALPELIKFAQAEDDASSLPGAATDALGPIATHLDDPAPVIDVLIPLMEREDTQRAAITSLGKIGPRAEKAIPHLIQHLEPEPSYIFDAALGALGKMGDTAEPAVDRLLELMESDERNVRWNAMETLSQIPVSAERVVPKLRAILKEETDDSTKYRVLNAIETYQAKEMIPDLIAELKKDDEFYRSVIINSLATFGPGAKDAVQPILDVMQEEKEGFTVRNAGIQGLIKIAPQDPRFVKYLVDNGYIVESPKPGEIQ